MQIDILDPGFVAPGSASDLSTYPISRGASSATACYIRVLAQRRKGKNDGRWAGEELNVPICQGVAARIHGLLTTLETRGGYRRDLYGISGRRENDSACRKPGPGTGAQAAFEASRTQFLSTGSQHVTESREIPSVLAANDEFTKVIIMEGSEDTTIILHRILRFPALE